MKLKRFLTGILSAAMALSICAMPVMADDNNENAAGTVKTSASTIDTGKTGSITIHKYLMENVPDDKTGNRSNGELITDDTKIPTDAEVGKHVGFTLYRVKNADELIAYYNGSEEEWKVSNFVSTDSRGYKTVADDKLKKDVTYLPDGKTSQVYTDDNGVAEFTSLPIGLYVVIETDKPASVTTEVEPFLVSVPMTRIGADVEENQTMPGATQWLYDIHVYPKNSTKKGEVVLQKKGVVGSDKTEDKLENIAGVQFKLEHQVEGTSSWEEILPPKGENETQPQYFVTDSEGKIKVSNLNTGKYRFTEIGYADGSSSKYIITKNGQYEFEIVPTADGTQTEVDLTSTATEDNENDYTANGMTITIYNYAPDMNKQVQDSHNTNQYQEAADYDKNAEISYKVDVTIPANIAKLRTFYLKDTPTHLVDQVNTVKVYTDSDMNTLLANDSNSVYTVTKEGTSGFKVTFTPSALSAYAGKTLYVGYTAKFATDGEGNFAGLTTADGNPNKMDLIYSSSTSTDGEGGNDKTSTIEDEAVVYSFQIDINKKAGSSTGKPLQDVKFDLYEEVAKATGEGILTAEQEKAYGFEAKDNVSYKLVQKDLTTDENGKVSVKGLANGNYWLVETKTVEDYNLLGKPVAVKLDIVYKTSWKATDTWENGVLVKHEVSQNNEVFNVLENSESGATTNNGTQSGYADGTDNRTQVGGQATTIINKKGFQLPVTGGFGTLIFSGIGVLLVLAGVGVLFSMKKKNDRA